MLKHFDYQGKEAWYVKRFYEPHTGAGDQPEDDYQRLECDPRVIVIASGFILAQRADAKVKRDDVMTKLDVIASMYEQYANRCWIITADFEHMYTRVEFVKANPFNSLAIGMCGQEGPGGVFYE